MTDQEIHQLFHILWTKAVGTVDYDKREWKQFADFVYSHIQLNRYRVAPTPLQGERMSRYERDPVI